jgi:hypothetical protein
VRIDDRHAGRELLRRPVNAPPPGVLEDDGKFAIPEQPIRRRLTGLPDFVVNWGRRAVLLPGLRALRWLADLDT